MALYAACLGTGLGHFVKVLHLLLYPGSKSCGYRRPMDPFALCQTLRAACERAATGQKAFNNRKAQILADVFCPASCGVRDPSSLSGSIFCSSPGPAVARPAQPGAAALMEKLLVLLQHPCFCRDEFNLAPCPGLPRAVRVMLRLLYLAARAGVKCLL